MSSEEGCVGGQACSYRAGDLVAPPRGELIEDTARKHFAERGYDRTSIRSIAQQAKVDPRVGDLGSGSKIEVVLGRGGPWGVRGARRSRR